MAILTGNRHNERYTFKRVQWENYQEHGSYDYILGGSIEQAVDSELKVTGSFSFEGYEIPDVNDLIRVYYSFTDDNGEEFNEPLATFIVSYANLTYEDTLDGLKANGTLDGQSLLTVLQDTLTGAHYTIKKNTNLIYEAQRICKALGLQVVSELSSFSMPQDHTFDGGTSYLEIVNWLLTSAGFVPAYPDEYGRVCMTSEQTINNREYKPDTTTLYPNETLYPDDKLYPRDSENDGVGYMFRNDRNSIMLPQIEQSNDWQTTPNVVRLLYNLDDACISAWAKNESGSKASLESRGNREKTYFEEISVLEAGDKRQKMVDLAKQTLINLSADIEYVQFKHAYVPIKIYDPVLIQYSDMTWNGNVDNISIELSPSTECQTKVKRVLASSITITSGSVVMR